MNVLFIASEMAPLAKTGGLGDVVGSLPKILRQKGIDARVVMPHYSMIQGGDYRFNYKVPRRSGDGDVSVHEIMVDDVPVYLLKSWPYFVDDGKIYSVWDWDTPKFIYFAQMAMGFVWELAQGNLDEGDAWWPDVLHAHDWHMGLVPFLLHEARFNEHWQDMASVLTLHNMAFQGPHAGGWLWEEGFNNRDHPLLRWQDWKDNLLAIGIAYANKVNTVSPNHATEMHYPRFGEGLQDLIWAKDADFSGILNGIDTEFFDPETDPVIHQTYNADNFRERRHENKIALQRELGLPESVDTPLVSIISRITSQKGMDFAIPALRQLLSNTDMQFVGLGMGDFGLQSAFGKLGEDFGGKARTMLRMDMPLARKIYAASDLILLPSRYEPCGLAQIIAMRYGCLPLVRETGGLVDTVDNYDGQGGGTGFRFLFEETEALVGTVRWALDTYHNQKDHWQQMQDRAMRHDWGWGNRANEYVKLYDDAMKQKRAWRKFAK